MATSFPGHSPPPILLPEGAHDVAGLGLPLAAPASAKLRGVSLERFDPDPQLVRAALRRADRGAAARLGPIAAASTSCSPPRPAAARRSRVSRGRSTGCSTGVGAAGVRGCSTSRRSRRSTTTSRATCSVPLGRARGALRHRRRELPRDPGRDAQRRHAGRERRRMAAAAARDPDHDARRACNLLLIDGAAGRMLGGVDTVILDEVHAVVGNQRGTHLDHRASNGSCGSPGEFQRDRALGDGAAARARRAAWSAAARSSAAGGDAAAHVAAVTRRRPRRRKRSSSTVRFPRGLAAPELDDARRRRALGGRRRRSPDAHRRAGPLARSLFANSRRMVGEAHAPAQRRRAGRELA